jgi:RIO kinase 1
MVYLLDFFGKKGVCVLSLRQLFDFVTDPTISDENIDLYLEKV